MSKFTNLGYQYHCNTCDHRTEGCHAVCKEYLEIKAKNEALKAEHDLAARSSYYGRPGKKRKEGRF